MRMPPLPADSIHARACKLKCEKILTRPLLIASLKYISVKTRIIFFGIRRLKYTVVRTGYTIHTRNINPSGE